jgi:uncharacterized iron-regulated membrane protein
MRSAIPFHVVHDSAKWSTIPVKTKMRTASQRNPGPLPPESPDHFDRNTHLEMRLPSEKAPNVAFRLEEGDGSNPRQRVQLVLARKDGSMVREEPFSVNSRGRQWRLYARFAHTGEMFGILGRSVALLACVSALMLVWTGFSLSLRCLASWGKRKSSHEKLTPRRTTSRSSAQEAAGV